MSTDSSAKYYEDNKERLQKKLMKDIKVFLGRKKKKSNNMIMNNTKIYQNMRNKSWLGIEKKVQNEKKMPHYNQYWVQEILYFF